MIRTFLGANWLEVGIGLAFVLLASFAYAAWERGNAYESQLKVFTIQTEAVGQQAALRAKGINDGNKKRLKDTLASLADVRECLRDNACAGRSNVPLVPSAPAGDTEFSFNIRGLTEAVERFRTGVQGLVTKGRLAQADARACTSAWPVGAE